MAILKIDGLKSNVDGYGTYRVYLHPETYASLKPTDANTLYLQNPTTSRVFVAVADSKYAPGTVAMNTQERMSEVLSLSIDKEFVIPDVKNIPILNECKISVQGFGSGFSNGTKSVKVDCAQLQEMLKVYSQNHPFYLNKDSSFVISYNEHTLKLTPNILNNDLSTATGLYHENVVIQFEKGFGSMGELIVLSNGTSSSATSIFNGKSFDFSNLKIGGLSSELNTIFRKVFSTRILPPTIVDKLKINHIKGLILYGPPGTGKTLIARQLSQCLSASSIQIVNGPELLNAYIGKSEENIRKLFQAADDDQKAGKQSLHVVVFDEFDSLCRKRGDGSSDAGSRVNDNIVTQLLSKIDGVKQLNNVLLIGMTNRIELLDPAILRPGRFEVHIKIGLADEKGRHEILNIHTADLKKNKCLADDVDMSVIAHDTENYSGAELEGLVKDARSYAINEHIDFTNLAKKIAVKDIKVTQAHFVQALNNYTPAFGTNSHELSYYDGGLGTNTTGDDTLIPCLQTTLSDKTNLYTVLFVGEPHAGKTANSIHIARSLKFPYTKVISNNAMLGFSDSAKVTHILDIFNQAYLCESACIVIDNLDNIIDYHRDSVTGVLRFSNTIYQTIKALVMRRPQNPTHKLAIIINLEPMQGVSIAPYMNATYELGA